MAWHGLRSGGTLRRLVAPVCLATALTLAVSVAGSSPARAVAYRYWTYWQGGPTGWTFATAGPASLIPADGSVDGWRFAVTTQAGRAGDAPAIAASFDEICAATPSVAGSKRVALVVDSGTAEAAPSGQTPPAPIATCVVAAPEATGYQVLRSVATVRTEGGLVCAVADYPTGECAPVIDEPDVPTATNQPAAKESATNEPATDAAASSTPAMPAAQENASGAGAPWLTAVVLAFVAVVGVLLWRRRRDR